MHWQIPGTVIQADCLEAEHIHQQFQAMFLAGGMVLSQVASLTGLEPYTIQNWVKRGFLTAPVKKRYSMSQLCRILNINMLKAALPMEEICGLLGYINGKLNDNSDDIIDDAQLYFLFVQLAAHHRKMEDPAGRETYLQQVLSQYPEPVPGARERVAKVLRVMLTAWAASQLRLAAMQMLRQLKTEN